MFASPHRRAIHRATWDAGALTVAKHEGDDSTHLEAVAVHTIVRRTRLVSVAVIDPAVDDGLHTIGPPGAIRFLRLRL